MQIREGVYYFCPNDKYWNSEKQEPRKHLGLSSIGTPCKRKLWDKIIASEVPTLWRDMTPEQKGALLLAHHEGKVIETLFGKRWIKVEPEWSDDSAYRVAPKHETVTLHGAGYEWTQADLPCDDDTHRITFDLIDGEPDCTSIKMEKL